MYIKNVGVKTKYIYVCLLHFIFYKYHKKNFNIILFI